MFCISPKVGFQNLVFRLKKIWTLGEIQIVKKSLGEIQGTLWTYLALVFSWFLVQSAQIGKNYFLSSTLIE